MATLSLVATPIGNLEDITLRALETLRTANRILCEDTRQTAKLLQHYDIRKPLESYHHHSDEKKLTQIVEWLKNGQHLALVTDAGTPGVSDPGNQLIRRVVTELGESVKIEAIPGPSALAAAISISGLPTDKFHFLGFIPHKKGRETLFRTIADSDETCVMYESPHRVLKTLGKLVEVLGADRPMVIARELTKHFEERIGETVGECLERLTSHPESQKGEFVIMVGGK